VKRLRLQHDYPVAPETLWALVTDYVALAEVIRGIVHFEGLAVGRTDTGQRLEVRVSLFGKLPPQPYHIEVVHRDDVGRVLESSERGAGVRSWRHRLRVEPTAPGSRLTDEIEIDAGWLTPLFALRAGYLYRARHKPRLRLLGVHGA